MKTIALVLSLTAALATNSNCVNSTSQKSPAIADSLSAAPEDLTKAKGPITGADQGSQYLDYLKGKKNGIVVNQTYNIDM